MTELTAWCNILAQRASGIFSIESMDKIYRMRFAILVGCCRFVIWSEMFCRV